MALHAQRPGYPLDVVKLHVDVMDDARIIEVGPLGEIAFYRSICYGRRYGVYVFANELGAHFVPAGRRTALKKVDHMVAVGLWASVDGCLDLRVESPLFEPWPTRKDSRLAAEHRRRRSLVSHHLRSTVVQRDGGLCLHCRSDDDLTIDHVHPISLGGTDDLSNLQLLCRRCNSSKKDR